MKKTIIIVLIILLLGVGGFFLWRNVISKKSPVGKNNTVITPHTPSKLGQQAQQIEQVVTDITAKDSDMDGLTDTEEKALGTDPNKPDTDNDGVLDRDEVQIWKTNPLKADTDGDGYSDGYEIRRGMNPLVPDKKK